MPPASGYRLGVALRACAVAALLAAGLAAPGSAATFPAKLGHSFLPVRPGPRQLQALTGHDHALVELDRARGGRAVPVLRSHGGELVSRGLAIWRMRSDVARRLLPDLTRKGLVRSLEPDVPVAADNHIQSGDPLLADEWWYGAVGADKAEPPGPGKRVTLVDSGVDFSHPEFAGRPNTFPLNTQEFATPEERHGTAVASIVGAPVDGKGLVGVYPQAVLQTWDASPGGKLMLSAELAGIDAAASSGSGVINLSLGSPTYSRLEEEEILVSFGRGSLIVAAAGNQLETGNPLNFPASLSHVLTVGATGRDGNPTPFSSTSNAVDLAAPGEDIPAAVPLSLDPSGYAVVSGTSFAAPIVSGAAAWIWTVRPALDNTQLFDLLRLSALDVGAPGFDRETGFGLLDIPAALASRAPASDHQEPNDDIDQIRANGLFREPAAALTTRRSRRRTISARLDATEDPEDVYRVWVPARRTVVVTVRPTTNVSVALWGPRTRTVFERGRAQRRDLIDRSLRPGRSTERVSVHNRRRRGIFVYVDCFLGRNVGNAAYGLTVRTRARR